MQQKPTADEVYIMMKDAALREIIGTNDVLLDFMGKRR